MRQRKGRAKGTAGKGRSNGGALGRFLSKLECGDAMSHGNLTVVPIFGPSSGPTVTALDDALGAGTIAVTEVDEGGHVPTLDVLNQGEWPVVLFDGEELVGGKQNRILNTTILVPVGVPVAIPVSCVEEGRWSWRTRAFSTAGRMLKQDIRRTKLRCMMAEDRAGGDAYRTDQGEIWEQVDAYATRRGATTETRAMSDVFEKDAAAIEAFVTSLPVLDGQLGIAAFVGGAFAGIDVVGRPDVYRKLHPKLLRAVAAEAIDRMHAKPKQRRRTVRGVLRELTQADRTQQKPPGLGHDVRLRKGTLLGSALVAEEGVVHLTACDG